MPFTEPGGSIRYPLNGLPMIIIDALNHGTNIEIASARPATAVSMSLTAHREGLNHLARAERNRSLLLPGRGHLVNGRSPHEIRRGPMSVRPCFANHLVYGKADEYR